MAYIDNYPNGYKSGYSSADDPDRKDYSPYGLERQQRDAMARGTIIGEDLVFSKEEIEKREKEYGKYVEQKSEWYKGNREYRAQQEQIAKEKNQEESRKEAFAMAERRFEALKPIKKIWLQISGKAINNYRGASVETLDSLYRGKSR